MEAIQLQTVRHRRPTIEAETSESEVPRLTNIELFRRTHLESEEDEIQFAPVFDDESILSHAAVNRQEETTDTRATATKDTNAFEADLERGDVEVQGRLAKLRKRCDCVLKVRTVLSIIFMSVSNEAALLCSAPIPRDTKVFPLFSKHTGKFKC